MSPTIFLIPGSWHTPVAFDPLAERLKALGLPTKTQQLASVGGSTTVAEDAAALAAGVDAISDSGADIVLVAHSYAGVPASAMLRDASKQHRQQQGKKGGVVGIVYIAGFVLPEGPTVVESLGGSLPPWQKVDREKGCTTVIDPVNVFYADMPPDQAEHRASLLVPHSLPSSHSPVGHAGHAEGTFDGRRAYIHTKIDGALPPAIQDMMLEQSGVEWEVKRIKSGHSPFLSRTDELAEYIAGLCARWSA